jgi:hypothetical protein
MKNNAVVFSSWMPSNAIHRGNIYLSYIRDYFGDCDVYIGINSNSDLAWVDMIESILPEAQIALVDPEMTVDSDVPGFQVALNTLKNSGNVYDKVYFMHSKGISYPSDSQWFISCRDYFMQFAEKRGEYDELLKNDTVGGWAHIARKFDMKASKHPEQILTFMNQDSVVIPFDAQSTMWLLTHYVIKGNVVKWFLDNAKPEFFTSNLQDRYFFEVCFPLIVDLYGKKRENQVFWE